MKGHVVILLPENRVPSTLEPVQIADANPGPKIPNLKSLSTTLDTLARFSFYFMSQMIRFVNFCIVTVFEQITSYVQLALLTSE